MRIAQFFSYYAYDYIRSTLRKNQFSRYVMIEKNWPGGSGDVQTQMETGLRVLVPESERVALQSLCHLMKMGVKPDLLPKEATIDDCINCFVVNKAGKVDLSKRSLELALVATALSSFKASLLHPFQAGAQSTTSPTAEQIQILSWENSDSFAKQYKRIGEVQGTLRMLRF